MKDKLRGKCILESSFFSKKTKKNGFGNVNFLLSL